MRNVSRRDALVSMATAAGVALAGIAEAQVRAKRGQPRMHAALNSLRRAERELRAADADKGGHREKAIDLVQKAISEVEAGIGYDRTH